jgi:ABC-2 type transport system permease protein
MATTVTQVPSIGVGSLPRSAGRANFAGALRSEFTKIRSVRSTYWTLFALIVVCVGIGALSSWGVASQMARLASGAGGPFHPGLRVGGPPPASVIAHLRAVRVGRAASTSLFGLLVGQLIIVVLGSLTMTAEYSTGMIRTSLATMPRRGTVFASKAIVFGGVALVVGLITSFLAFFVGQAIMSSQHINTTLGHPGALRQVIGGGLFLAVCGLLSFGLGAILRHTAGAIATAIGLLFVVWILGNFLPSPPSGWFGQADIDKWLPFNAGAGIWQNQINGVNPFSPWVGFGVFCAYAAVALIAGLILFKRRDA